MNNIRYTNEILFKNFEQLEIKIVPHQKTVWLYFDPKPRPCFTLTLLKELDRFQSILKHHEGKLPFNGELVEIEFNVITSRQSSFSLGGDLDYFINCIKNRDRDALYLYAKAAIDAVYYNHAGRELDITTISLIHGNALGGGFEAALSSHILIAEDNAEMGLPEVLFNLFPGMGAYNLLLRRLTPAMTERLILSGRKYTAEELHEIGVVDYLAETGAGESTVNDFIRSNRNRSNSLTSINKVRNIINPPDYNQLIEIGNVWVDTALGLDEKELRIMSRLVRSQERISANTKNGLASKASAF